MTYLYGQVGSRQMELVFMGDLSAVDRSAVDTINII